ncbi:MAG: hypothetical protein GXZ18_00450 [Synergistaceae bacterium]|nr:hypothetical protein [Synergistaceae bacterium]
MKKKIILLIAVTAIFASACGVFAHPAKNVTVSWDKAQETLQISAEHHVNDASKHYVLSMTIFDGNNQVLIKQYTKQDSTEKFSDKVVLKGMNSGTKIRVQLVDNIMGSTEQVYFIPK